MSDENPLKVPRPYELIDWPRFFSTVGLDTESTDRLTRLLLIHMLMDRLITGVLASRWAHDDSKPEIGLAKVAAIRLAQRIDLAELCGAISEETAASLRAVNEVRNRCVHYSPRRGWALDEGIPELVDETRFTDCAKRGFKALQALVQTLWRGDEGREADGG